VTSRVRITSPYITKGMSYLGYIVMIAAPRNSVRMSPLPRWPLLRTMQDAKYSHLILRFKDFVDSDVWGAAEKLSRVCHRRAQGVRYAERIAAR
jgi:hypothetical protein